LVNERGHLKRIPAYTYGLTCVSLGMLFYQLTELPIPQATALMKLSIAAGLGTVIPRILLWLREMRLEIEENNDESTNKGRTR
jgi:hypothetical protein